MYLIYVGIDVSKGTIDVALLIDQETFYLGQFSNDKQGFSNLIAAICALTSHPQSSWFFCFENTGVYSKALLNWLSAKGIACKEENPMKISRSLGLKRGKDDKSDARDICQYAFRHRDTIQPTQLSNALILKLKTLLSRRNFLVRKKTASLNSFKAHKIALDPSLLPFFEEQNQLLIHTYKEQIKAIEDLIKEVIKEDDQVNKNYLLAQSVKGIGPMISAYMIAFTHNFEHFDNARQFACYSGIAPFPNRSGTSLKGKTKVSHIANKQIKAILSNGANAAICFDKELKVYYQRKRSEGKEYGTVINVVKNKLVQRVFAVIKRQSAYVPLASYA